MPELFRNRLKGLICEIKPNQRDPEWFLTEISVHLKDNATDSWNNKKCISMMVSEFRLQ